MVILVGRLIGTHLVTGSIVCMIISKVEPWTWNIPKRFAGRAIVCMIISKVEPWTWNIPKRFAGIVGIVSEYRHPKHHTATRQRQVKPIL
ncbi:unnamed protein product [Protopolystoma xenopodis]|uniref:Uncharacterized protein n=1 Tax=Protopolystoma xenopodis TaxID=117903 RepID=A0A448X6A0_9PLAT|nr:unnamed protein product [Protopolystoma xenopodis]